MPTLHFITHPEVVIDPAVPVSDWPLSAEGVRRMALALDRPWMGNLGAIFSSAERKALDAARMMAGRFGLFPVIIEGLGENDRSATGYLPKAEFEAVADAFFARPEESVRGWERAADAQSRASSDRSALSIGQRCSLKQRARAFLRSTSIGKSSRVVAAVEPILTRAHSGGNIAIVFHGGVGALLLCHFKGVPISRVEDQPGDGGGNVYSLDTATRLLLSGWRRIED